MVQKRLERTKNSLLLLGARQVGKTTLLNSMPLKLFINLADEDVFLTYAKDPARLIREVRALKDRGIIAVDEVQRVPKLMNSIQVIIDEKKPFQFILTGSSARKLKRGHANLLPGRIVLEHLDPLMVSEVGTGFDIERAMQVGCLPGIYLNRESGTDLLETYAAVYLREEIQLEAITRDIGSYSRFLDVAAETSGQWINYSKISSDSEIPKETIRRFFSILEDTLIAFRIAPFKPVASKRRASQRDRIIMFDVGVRNAILGLHKQQPAPHEAGLLFEQLTLLQCIYYNHAYRKGWNITSYRTDAGAEVDLVIDTGKNLVAIECKAGKNIHESDLGGLRSLESIAHKPIKKYIVYRGTSRQMFSQGALALPFMDFFLEEIHRI